MALTLPAATFTSYITPTTPSLVQFTPAPTCFPTTAGEQLWHVTGACYPGAPYGNPHSVEPPHCTYTRAGNPEENKAECGNRWGGQPEAGLVGSCPVGFTSAGIDYANYHYKPFDTTLYEPTRTVISYDVTAEAVICCPSISGLNFKARTTGMGNVYTESTTVHNGVLWTMYVPIPHCYDPRPTALDGKTVTMGLYHDSRIYDKKKRDTESDSEHEEDALAKRQRPWGPGWTWGETGETTTAVFNARRDTIWADEYRYRYTVFHGTHTCYENCNRYFTESYYNTDPNYTPPPPTSTPTSDATGSGWVPYPTGGWGGEGEGSGFYPLGAIKERSSTPVEGNGAAGMKLGGGLVLFSAFAAGVLGLTLAL